MKEDFITITAESKEIVFTVLFNGTESNLNDSNSPRYKSEKYPDDFGELISTLRINIVGKEFVDYIGVDGVGSGKVDYQTRLSTPTDKSQILQKIAGYGVDENVDHVINALKGVNTNHYTRRHYVPLVQGKIIKVIVVGWSRGGASAIKLAYRMSKDELLKHLPVNIFIVEPVAGLGCIDQENSTINDNVKHAVIIYNKHDISYGFSPIFPKISNPEITQVVYDIFPGHHSTGVGNPSWREHNDPLRPKVDMPEVSRLIKFMAHAFLTAHGTQLQRIFKLNQKDVLSLFNTIKQDMPKYEAFKEEVYTVKQFKGNSRKFILRNKDDYTSNLTLSNIEPLNKIDKQANGYINNLEAYANSEAFSVDLHGYFNPQTKSSYDNNDLPLEIQELKRSRMMNEPIEIINFPFFKEADRKLNRKEYFKLFDENSENEIGRRKNKLIKLKNDESSKKRELEKLEAEKNTKEQQIKTIKLKEEQLKEQLKTCQEKLQTTQKDKEAAGIAKKQLQDKKLLAENYLNESISMTMASALYQQLDLVYQLYLAALAIIDKAAVNKHAVEDKIQNIRSIKNYFNFDAKGQAKLPIENYRNLTESIKIIEGLGVSQREIISSVYLEYQQTQKMRFKFLAKIASFFNKNNSYRRKIERNKKMLRLLGIASDKKIAEITFSENIVGFEKRQQRILNALKEETLITSLNDFEECSQNLPKLEEKLAEIEITRKNCEMELKSIEPEINHLNLRAVNLDSDKKDVEAKIRTITSKLADIGNAIRQSFKDAENVPHKPPVQIEENRPKLVN